jgi:hypothetical protein
VELFSARRLTANPSRLWCPLELHQNSSRSWFLHASHRLKTRREFLVYCSGAAAAFTLLPAAALGGEPAPAKLFTVSAAPSYAELERQVNTAFRVRLSPTRVVELTLLNAPLARPAPRTAGRRPRPDAGNERFSLVFVGPGDALLDSAIHQVEHDRLGCFEMYLGSIGPRDGTQVRYQAVFNRPVPAPIRYPRLMA